VTTSVRPVGHPFPLTLIQPFGQRFTMSIGLETLSFLCGWGYVVCWGVSLYPPILLNAHSKSVEGLSIDFAYLNFLGCVCYLVSVSMLYFSTTVRLEYALAAASDAHKVGAAPKEPLVRLNDVIYGVHSLVLVSILLYQFYFSGYRRSPSQQLSRTVKIISGIGIVAGLLLVLHAYEISTTRAHYQLVDVANIFGTVKVFFSSVKYMPQAYFNYQRKAVKGFSVKGYLVDILGGVLCCTQLVLDGILLNDISGVYKHPTKMMLAFVTIAFNVIFLVQYHIYANAVNPTVYNVKSTKVN